MENINRIITRILHTCRPIIQSKQIILMIITQTTLLVSIETIEMPFTDSYNYISFNIMSPFLKSYRACQSPRLASRKILGNSRNTLLNFQLYPCCLGEDVDSWIKNNYPTDFHEENHLVLVTERSTIFVHYLSL